MAVKLMTKHHLEFLSLERDFTSSSESTLIIKMPHCLKSHVTDQLLQVRVDIPVAVLNAAMKKVEFLPRT